VAIAAIACFAIPLGKAINENRLKWRFSNAIRAKNYEQVHACLQAGANPNWPILSEDDVSPWERLKHLVHRSSDDAKGDPQDAAPLHQDTVPLLYTLWDEIPSWNRDLTRNKQREAAEAIALALLKRGADLNRFASDGDSPLTLATMDRFSGAVQYLVQHQANVNLSKGEDFAPLVDADASDSEYLLEHGADPNRGTSDGTPVLLWACAQLDVVKVRELLQHGANPMLIYADGETLIFKVAGEVRGNFVITHKGVSPAEITSRACEIAKMLVDRGVDPAAKSLKGRTALSLFTEKDRRSSQFCKYLESLRRRDQ
jgi:ankyrin repeat protein